MRNLAEPAVVEASAGDLEASSHSELTRVDFPDRFHILRRVGQGGMAEVFVALRREPDGSTKPVVIKRPLPELAAQAEFLNMFQDEARIASVLDHPNVARVHEIVKRPGGCLLVLELVDGRALSALMVRGERIGRRLDARMSAHIVARAAEGLHYAHGCKDASGKPLDIVHRDVSPQNILISFSGDVKVIDFGIAQALGRITRTKTGARKGKSGYMAPEQVKGMDLDARVDVFGLGIVLWELLCARRLFVRHDEYRTMNALLVDAIPRPSEFAAVPPDLERITLKALERDPNQRYRTADELRAELDAFVAGCGGVERSELGNTVESFFPGEGSLLEPQVEGSPRRSARRSGPTLPTVPAIAAVTSTSGLALERRQVLRGAGAMATVGLGAFLASIAGRIRFRTPTAFAAGASPPRAAIEFELINRRRPTRRPVEIDPPVQAPAAPPPTPRPPAPVLRRRGRSGPLKKR
jgi:eukaryotic-like serine/threonine-protein kinase